MDFTFCRLKLGFLCASQCSSHAIKCGQSETVASLGNHFKQSLSTLSAPVTEQQGKRERGTEQYLQDSSGYLSPGVETRPVVDVLEYT